MVEIKSSRELYTQNTKSSLTIVLRCCQDTPSTQKLSALYIPKQKRTSFLKKRFPLICSQLLRSGETTPHPASGEIFRHPFRVPSLAGYHLFALQNYQISR